MMNDQYLTIKQVAEQLQLSESTIRRYIKSGRLDAVRIGRNVRVPRQAVAELLHTQTLREAPPIYQVAKSGMPDKQTWRQYAMTEHPLQDQDKALNEPRSEILFSGLTSDEFQDLNRKARAWLDEIMSAADLEEDVSLTQDPLLQLAGAIVLDEPLNLGDKLDDYIGEVIWQEFHNRDDEQP